MVTKSLTLTAYIVGMNRVYHSGRACMADRLLSSRMVRRSRASSKDNPDNSLENVDPDCN